MRIILLGGSGLLGRHLARHLVARGDEVLVLGRDAERIRRRVPAGVRVGSWSSDDVTGLASAVSGVDAVVNLAGAPIGPWPWTLGRRRSIVESRLASTRALVAALAALPEDRRPSVFVNLSGTDRYTGQDATEATEASPSGAGFLAELCLAWEAEAVRAGGLGVRVVLLRTGFVLARDAAVLRLYALPFRFGLGGPLGNGRQWMSWIHVDDWVGIACLAIDDERVAGPLNAVAPIPARQADVAAAIGAALGRRSWLAVPAGLIRLALGEASILALGSRRVAPAVVTALGYDFRQPDLAAALLDVLG